MDMQMKFYRKLPIPRDLKEQFPADERSGDRPDL